MQSTAIQPQRAQLAAAVAGLMILSVFMAAFPSACVAFALLVPPLACPLIGRKQQWAAWAAAAAPAAVSLLYGFDVLYSLSLILPGMLPLAATLWMKSRKGLGGPQYVVALMGAYAASMAAVVVAASHALGAGLSAGLTQLLIRQVEASDQAGSLLYRFAAAGLVSVPDAYRQSNPLGFLLDPALARQLLLSLRLTVQASLDQALPSLFVQFCILGGLFTSLRVQRMHCAVLIVGPDPDVPGGRKTRVLSPPGFRLLTLPSRLRWALCMMALASLVLVSAQSAVSNTLGLLFYATFSCAFQVVGAAVVVCMLSARSPERAPMFGALAAALYLLFPMALFMIGVADQALHFRTRLLEQTNRHKEE